MKKFSKILSLMVLACAAIVLVACKKTTTTTSGKPTTSTTAKVDSTTTTKKVDGTTTEKVDQTTTKAPTTATTVTTTVEQFEEDYSFNATHHWFASLNPDSENVDGYEEHQWGDATVKTAGTPTVKAVMQHTCTVCEHTEEFEGEFAYNFLPEADSILAKYDSKQSEPWNYTLNMDEEGWMTVSNKPVNNYNAMSTYATGDASNVALKIEWKGNENSSEGAQFIIKVNNLNEYSKTVKASANQEAQSVVMMVPAEMEKIIFMFVNTKAEDEIVVRLSWVALTWGEPKVAFDAETMAIMSTKECTTPGLEDKTKVEKLSQVPTMNIKVALEEIAKISGDDNKVVLIDGFAVELKNDSYGNMYLVDEIDSQQYAIQVYGTAPLNTAFTYTGVENQISKFSNPKKFATDLASEFVEGQRVLVLAVLVNYNDNTPELKCEFVEAYPQTLTALTFQGHASLHESVTPEAVGEVTLSAQAATYWTDVTVTVTPKAGFRVTEIAVYRTLSGIKETLDLEAPSFKIGLNDKVKVTVEEIPTAYTVTPKLVATAANVATSYYKEGGVETETSADGGQFSIRYYNVMRSSGNFQIKKSSGYVGNNDLFVGDITSISVTNANSNLTYTSDLTLYVSATPIDMNALPEGTAITIPSVNDGGKLKVDVTLEGARYFVLKNTNTFAVYLSDITVEFKKPTTNVFDVKTATCEFIMGTKTDFLVDDVKVADKFSFAGGDWAGYKHFDCQPTATHLVITLSAKGYTGDGAYAQFKLDNEGNALNSTLADISPRVTEAGYTYVIPMSTEMLTALGSQDWKICLAYGKSTPEWYVWECYFLLAEPVVVE